MRASSRDVAKALNIIGANFLTSSDKKALDDLIYKYFTLKVSVISGILLHSNEYNLHFKDNDDSDEFEDFFQTEGN